ncbi:unnamed protein product [Ixodes pacificus]
MRATARDHASKQTVPLPGDARSPSKRSPLWLASLTYLSPSTVNCGSLMG